MDFIAKLLYCYTLTTCFCWRCERGQISKDVSPPPPELLLPEDLVVNILTRLPLKDIFRLKVVCKSWLKLISCPYFTSNYVRNSPYTLIIRAQNKCSRNPNSKKPLVLSFSLLEFATGKGGGGGGELTYHYNIIPLLTPKKLKLTAANSRLSLIGGGGGSCDGSVFMLHKTTKRRPFFSKRRTTLQRVYLYNPVSGSCVKIVPDDIYRDGEWEPWWVYKVGFIPSINTYKLVRFNYDFFFLDNPEIFTVGSDENWRKLDDFGRLLCVGGAFGVICFNGAFHWLLYRDETDDAADDKIYTFNLLEEKNTSGIPLPRGVCRRDQESRCELTILNDRLSVAERSVTRMVIWTMREYGVAASWSRLAVVALGSPAVREIWMRNDDWDVMPIAVLANGDILFAHTIGEGLCLYNLQEKRLTHTFDSPPDDDPSATYWVDYDNTYVPAFHS